MDIVGIIGTALGLASKIMSIVADKGDKADNMRLKDIPGWTTLKKKCRKKEAVNKFKVKWAQRNRKPK